MAMMKPKTAALMRPEVTSSTSQEVDRVLDIGVGVEAERSRADDIAAHDADRVADGDEERQR